jgi:hypothetical protein
MAELGSENAATEVLEAARTRLGHRWGGGWIDRHRWPGHIWIFACAVDPAPHEVEALDEVVAGAGFAFTIIPVKYSFEDLLGFYRGVDMGADGSSDALVSFGMDAPHNALCLTLRRLDDSAIENVRAQLPADALRIEVHPRAGHAFAD